jgi:hypothetical protein
MLRVMKMNILFFIYLFYYIYIYYIMFYFLPRKPVCIIAFDRL